MLVMWFYDDLQFRNSNQENLSNNSIWKHVRVTATASAIAMNSKGVMKDDP